jgi:RNA polymerase subunit RPABC4/transcription elongation factor Spt4
MAGHSQNRLSPEDRRRCPKCGRKGLGQEKRHHNTESRVLTYYRECRYCTHVVVTSRD